jgi:transketolase
LGAEAGSLAAHLGLDNLCWIYDNNHITIEGSTSLAFTEDVAARSSDTGGTSLRVGDANDLDRLSRRSTSFRKTEGRPTLIILDSHIGYGSPNKQDTAAAHGEPLGDDEVRLTKRSYGWPEDAQFWYPIASASISPLASVRAGAAAHARWTALMRRTGPRIPSCERDRPDAAARFARGMGSQPSRLRGRCQGRRRT